MFLCFCLQLHKRKLKVGAKQYIQRPESPNLGQAKKNVITPKCFGVITTLPFQIWPKWKKHYTNTFKYEYRNMWVPCLNEIKKLIIPYTNEQSKDCHKSTDICVLAIDQFKPTKSYVIIITMFGLIWSNLFSIMDWAFSDFVHM